MAAVPAAPAPKYPACSNETMASDMTIVVTVKDSCSQGPGFIEALETFAPPSVHLIYTYPNFKSCKVVDEAAVKRRWDKVRSPRSPRSAACGCHASHCAPVLCIGARSAPRSAPHHSASLSRAMSRDCALPLQVTFLPLPLRSSPMVGWVEAIPHITTRYSLLLHNDGYGACSRFLTAPRPSLSRV